MGPGCEHPPGAHTQGCDRRQLAHAYVFYTHRQDQRSCLRGERNGGEQFVSLTLISWCKRNFFLFAKVLCS